jgi:hypoxanthine phosphoribosyltransferase
MTSFCDIVGRVVIGRDRIARRIQELAAEVEAFYRDKPLTVVPVLAGAMLFASDFIRALPLKMKIGLVGLSSYRGAVTAPRELRVSFKLDGDVQRRCVLVLDDILDTGATLHRACSIVRQAGACDVRTAVLLSKRRQRLVDVRPDWVGFEIDDDFVVGYGLDFNDHFRNLPDVVVLKEELYAHGG